MKRVRRNNMKNMICKLYNLPFSIYNAFTLLLHRVQVGIKCRINGPLYLRGRGRILIGNNVVINSSRQSNPAGGVNRTTLWSYPGAELIIKDNVGISNSVIACSRSVTIEENVRIGVGCLIYDTDFHSSDYLSRRKEEQDIPVCKPVLIQKDAFIGANAIILKGVTIGERAIVGAGSVVTKDIPTGEIWGGNPARLIRKVRNKPGGTKE
jgi:acetyltransferase-like isoleucine patch superfamily enzyme